MRGAERERGERRRVVFVSRHFRPCWEFKSVPVKGRVYRYWYLRVPHKPRGAFSPTVWRSIYVGRERPAESAVTFCSGLGTGDRESLNRIRRKLRDARDAAGG